MGERGEGSESRSVSEGTTRSFSGPDDTESGPVDERDRPYKKRVYRCDEGGSLRSSQTGLHLKRRTGA